MMQSLKNSLLVIEGIEVRLERKAIKNIYLSVCPPLGEVALRVPLGASEKEIWELLRSKLAWIREKQKKFLSYPQPLPSKLVDGEIHHLFGKPYKLKCVPCRGKGHVQLIDEAIIELRVCPGASYEMRLFLLREWYRTLLKEKVAALLETWKGRIGVPLQEWRIKRMKTRWGSCNVRDRRIWLSLELATKREECIEYVLVHELAHLLERKHTKQFYDHMTRLLPDWEYRCDLLREEQ